MDTRPIFTEANENEDVQDEIIVDKNGKVELTTEEYSLLKEQHEKLKKQIRQQENYILKEQYKMLQQNYENLKQKYLGAISTISDLEAQLKYAKNNTPYSIGRQPSNENITLFDPRPFSLGRIDHDYPYYHNEPYRVRDPYNWPFM